MLVLGGGLIGLNLEPVDLKGLIERVELRWLLLRLTFFAAFYWSLRI